MDALREKWEDLRVWWFMRDAQQKQVILLAGLYLAANLMELASAAVQHRAFGGRRA